MVSKKKKKKKMGALEKKNILKVGGGQNTVENLWSRKLSERGVGL